MVTKQTTTYSANLVVFPPTPLSTFREIVCLPLFGCLPSSCEWSYPPLPPNCYSTPLLHHRQHLFTPKPFSPFTPIITPTLHDHPRTNLVPWKIAIKRAARGVFAEWDTFGFLFGVCDDAVWVVLNTPPPGGRCGTDQSSRFRLILAPMLILLPVTCSNAPRTPGQPGCHDQLLSVSRSWRA